MTPRQGCIYFVILLALAVGFWLRGLLARIPPARRLVDLIIAALCSLGATYIIDYFL